MTAQSGKDMLLKLDQTGSGSFITVAGLRTRALAFNAAPIDVTDAESAGRWRELLAGGGMGCVKVRHLDIQASAWPQQARNSL